MNVLLLCAPFIMIGFSFIAHRFLGFKRERFTMYCLFLLIAIPANAFSYSMANDYLDLLEILLIVFMLFEWLWNLFFKSSKRSMKLVVFFCSTAIFTIIMQQWLTQIDPTQPSLLHSLVVSKYADEKKEYVVKEKKIKKNKDVIRSFILFERSPLIPIEKTIKHYALPQQYTYSTFRIQWHKDQNRVVADVATDTYILWSLCEDLPIER